MKWALPLALLAGTALSSLTPLEVAAQAPEEQLPLPGTGAPLSALVPYDLDGDRTIQALSLMRAEAKLLASGKRREELSFVRALALSDLWIIAQVTDRAGLRKQIADSLGVEPGQVVAVLEQELAAVDRDVVQDVVGDARKALRMTREAGPAQAGDKHFGLRSQALFLHRVLESVQGSADARENVRRLAPLAGDPCPQLDACAPLYKNFERAGRRAIHALVLSSKAARAFENQPQDPFVMALSDTLAARDRSLKTITLQPNVRLQQAATRLGATEAGAGQVPDLLVLVAEDRIEYAFAPRVRVDDDGEVKLDESDQPAFPALAEVKLEGTFAPFVRPIDGLVKALRPLHQHFPSAKVAVGAAPGIKAHMIARSLLSAQAAGFSELALLGATPEGDLRTAGLEIVGALRASEVGPRELSVVVRLGGFSVKRAGPTMSIPRIKNEDGFSFDFASLIERAKPEQAKSTKLTFMSDVAAETLTEAVFLVAPRNKALTVVLP